MNPTEPLVELLFDRLAADDVPSEVADVVLAALGGEADLAAALDGRPATLDAHRASDPVPRARIYLSSMTVAGFRGVGPERTLAIGAGPGLTLVVGRNGSGKSSFAEAAELTLTGDSARWADRNSVWRNGWRNLHHPEPCRIEVQLRVDGVGLPTKVRRSWSADAGLGDARVSVTGANGPSSNLAELGLARPLELYRPFLTAAELGRLASGTQSQLFDAINAILGLDALTDADRHLLVAARPYDNQLKHVRAQRTALRHTLAGIDDSRARRAGTLLAEARPDLDRIAAILDEPVDPSRDQTVRGLQLLAEVALPEPAEVARLAAELRGAAIEAQRHDAAPSRASLRTAELLRLAVEQHTDGGDGPCPVCRVGNLDGNWRAEASATLTDLHDRTIAAQRAMAHLSELIRRTRTLIGDVHLPEIDGPDERMAALHTAVLELRDAPSAAIDLADHLAAHYPQVAAAAETAREYAATLLRDRDGGWQGVLPQLRAWLEAAADVPSQQATGQLIKAARTWLKAVGAQIRNERVAPFAAHSQRIWRELRQESNVELGEMTLTGTNTSRKVVFPVSVDGADNGTALGVMSQGEMQAFVLATFLPRSCAEESPFRFVIIDDPVQSMDPSKVDGLARVLAELAIDRQVVVFTHDGRLPDAVRRMEIDADVVEVTRAERSVVTVRPCADPVTRYLDDALALALSKEVDEEVRAPVVAELCRSALEAACHRVVWRTRVARGEPHAEIEAAIEAASRRLTTAFALALFDDADRAGEVMTKLRNRYGAWAVDVYQACRRGVHGEPVGELSRLVKDARRLTEALR